MRHLLLLLAGVAFANPAHLIMLHNAEGREVLINPEAITSLRGPQGEHNITFPPNVKCHIGLSDGKFQTVMETCDKVNELLETVKEPPK
jgi:gamma-glutamylcysteine synthetase